MPRFDVKAELTIDLVIEIEADTAEDAKAIFYNCIGVEAKLFNCTLNFYDVVEDSISEIDHFEIEQQ